MAKVIWTDRAINQLVKIRDYIAKDNENAATAFVTELMDHVEKILVPFPEAGMLHRKDDAGEERLLVYRGYVIGYFIANDGCYISAVVHGRRESYWTKN